ncbi:pentapeptide repeat-containing protein [Streptomyces sp. NRRL S-350]|uniref:pentapeptide repeat-containing protein n=1 Tax=Streptomyces sp. NRRL S-350 TaxID=1463902 RepID=UPI00099D60BE|nr:pentapeptide repeat-containing protein [Streptomyces sp. NRRL S-350]
MTTLASLLDYASLVPSPSASPSQPPSQSTSPGSPLWAVLLVGLGGALFGGAGAFAGAWRSSRALRQNTENTLEHERTRLLNERFNTAAELLGHREAACRLAGVHAMAGLADDWAERRQTCLDVLCAYLRMPYSPPPEDDAPAEQHLDWQANREIRHTVIRVIRDHQQPRSATSWDGHDYDFTGTVFDGGDFSRTRFTGNVSFNGAEFAGGTVSFDNAEFTGGTVTFDNAKFTGGTVTFDNAEFTGGTVTFHRAEFTGGTVTFFRSKLADGTMLFDFAKFTGSLVLFDSAELAGGMMRFRGTKFTGGIVNFGGTKFTGGIVKFRGTEFTGGMVTFGDAKFAGGLVDFKSAKFAGSLVTFHRAEFTGGTVKLRLVMSWAVPPVFDNEAFLHPPAGLQLPEHPGSAGGPAAS